MLWDLWRGLMSFDFEVGDWVGESVVGDVGREDVGEGCGEVRRR